MAHSNATWNDCLQYAAASDVGMRRANNQDAYNVVLAGDEAQLHKRGHLFVVADGMGAHVAGELASKLAADRIPHHYHKFGDFSSPEALQRAVLEANSEVNQRGRANPDFFNMGTTCSVLVLMPQGALVAHIGDSRVYRLRGEQLEQITFDHSLVWELRSTGQVTPESEIDRMLPKNVITRSLGPNPSVQVDIEGPYAIEEGDTFLVCSDGLTGQVEDEEIAVLLAHLDPEAAARSLVGLANLRGGPDNITVIVAKATGPRLTTSKGGGDPITLGKIVPPRRVHPVLWGMVLASVLAAAAFGIAQSAVGALIAAGLAVALLAAALVVKLAPIKQGIALGQRHRLGRGPYTNAPILVATEFVTRLADSAQRLREANDEQPSGEHWSAFDRSLQSARQAAHDSRPPEALRHCAEAIVGLTRNLRNRRSSKTSDSGVDSK